MFKKIFLIFIIIMLSFVIIACGKTTTGTTDIDMTVSDPNAQIIADHTVVDQYDKIPQRYIDEVKKMWINIPGESHSQAYRTGLFLLGQSNSKFAVNVLEGGSPDLPTSNFLRVSQIVRESWGGWGGGSGEASWYTWFAYPLASQPSDKDRIKDHIKYCNDNNLDLSAIGFGWCWDTTWMNDPAGTVDPLYHVRWAGASVGGPDGNKGWGLDAEDIPLVGNRVCMDTYLQATEEYRLFCKSNNYKTKVIFTTSPADSASGENGYQRQLKHEYIRKYVKANAERILFDYADILLYNDSGAQNITSWSDVSGNVHNYPIITDTNVGDGSVGHIGAAGAIRLAKAQWWMLARIAGWDGVSQ